MVSLKTPAERCDTVGVAFHASDLLLLVMLGFVEVIVDTDTLYPLRLEISNFMESVSYKSCLPDLSSIVFARLSFSRYQCRRTLVQFH